jgi:zinc D-Ala-D-Ala dipeptidase
MQFSSKIKIIWLVFTVINPQLCTIAFGQVKPVRNHKIYKQQVHTDSLLKMIELKTVMPDLVYDLRYGTKNNFTYIKLYKQSTITFLRLPAAAALKNVENALEQKGYRLKIFDAYRPYSVTKKMWSLVGDDRYVANPAKGSGHNRGLAVDLTIIDLKTGNELNMGTGFDSFTDSAHQDFIKLPITVLQNRKLLEATMEQYGFEPLQTEWWHYSWPNDRHYDVLDLDFKKLKN